MVGSSLWTLAMTLFLSQPHLPLVDEHLLVSPEVDDTVGAPPKFVAFSLGDPV